MLSGCSAAAACVTRRPASPTGRRNLRSYRARKRQLRGAARLRSAVLCCGGDFLLAAFSQPQSHGCMAAQPAQEAGPATAAFQPKSHRATDCPRKPMSPLMEGGHCSVHCGAASAVTHLQATQRALISPAAAVEAVHMTTPKHQAASTRRSRSAAGRRGGAGRAWQPASRHGGPKQSPGATSARRACICAALQIPYIGHIGLHIQSPREDGQRCPACPVGAESITILGSSHLCQTDLGQRSTLVFT